MALHEEICLVRVLCSPLGGVYTAQLHQVLHGSRIPMEFQVPEFPRGELEYLPDSVVISTTGNLFE